MDFKTEEFNRRELAVRHVRVMQKITAWLNHKNITPKQISVMSVVFGLLGFSANFATNTGEATPCSSHRTLYSVQTA